MSLSSNFLRFRRVVAFQSADTYSRSIVRRQQQIRIFSTTISEVNEKAYEELRWLSNEIRHHDDLYYNQQPQLKDDEYDALVRKEVEICEKYPELLVKLQEESGLGTRTTRNGRVGSSTSQKRLKREHLLAMLSLDNVHDEEQLSAWLKRVYKMTEETQSKDEKVLILTEPKLDGVSLSLRYELNEDKTYSLVWASTR
jgi:DNA ligase (NAD+)